VTETDLALTDMITLHCIIRAELTAQLQPSRARIAVALQLFNTYHMP
jgi:hypothetical protein